MSNETTDAELYRDWAVGDRGAGERLMARYLKPMARYFANKVANEADAEELVGGTFERVAKTLGGFEGRGSFAAYLFGVAYNVMREYVQRHRCRGETVDLETVALAQVLPSATQRMSMRRRERVLLEALRSLPLPTQIALELHLFEQLGRGEIAELLGVPAGTIASRLRRGRAQLDEALAKVGPGTDLDGTSRGLYDWMSSVRRVAGR